MSNLPVKKKRGRPKGWRKLVGKKDRAFTLRMVEELYNKLLNDSIGSGIDMGEIVRQCLREKYGMA